MRTRLVLLVAVAAVGIASAASQSENSRFVEHISWKVVQAVMPELAKHPELLSGSAKFSFRLDPQGHQSNVRVSSSSHNRFVEQTILRTIRASKFEPVPKRVLAEGPYESMGIVCEWSLTRPQ
jgi:TonB family protein